MLTICLVIGTAALLIAGALACSLWLGSDHRQNVEDHKKLYLAVYGGL